MSDLERIMAMAPVETGSMADVPPDAPAGAWAATCNAEPALTEEGHLRIKLSWTLDEAHTAGNETFAGGGKRVFDIPITFYPKGHPKKRSGWHERRLRDIAAALQIEVPEVQSWTGAAFVAFVKQLNGLKCAIYTRVEVDKESSEQRARVEFRPPKGTTQLHVAPSAIDDDDDDEAPAPPPKTAVKLGPNGRPLKKKTK